MCSNSTPCWSATEATQSLSQRELRKLGVMMENFMAPLLANRSLLLFSYVERR